MTAKPIPWCLPASLAILVVYLLLLCTAPPARGQTQHKIRTLSLVVQQQSDHVEHVIGPDGYAIRVRMEESLVGGEFLLVQVSSVEAGEWQKPGFYVGAFAIHGADAMAAGIREAFYDKERRRPTVKVLVEHRLDDSLVTCVLPRPKPEANEKPPDIPKITERITKLVNKRYRHILLRKSLTSEEIVFHVKPIFGLKFEIDPRAGERRYQAIKREIKQDAGSAKKERQRILSRLKGLAALLEQSPGVLGRPGFISTTTNPDKTLRDVCEWLALNELFERIEFEPPPVVSDPNILHLGHEVFDVLLSRKRDKPFKWLPEDEAKRLKQGVTVHCYRRFIPTTRMKRPDRGWVNAPAVGLSRDGVGAVLWQGPVGAKARYSEWLAFESDAAVAATVTKNPNEFHWAFVQGRDRRQYVRVLPKKLNESVEFGLRLTRPNHAGRMVQISVTAAQRIVTFPF